VRNGLYTCECVTIGHPDKLCDIISDSILDEYLKQDPDSRVACECAVKDNKVWVFGEVTSKGEVDVPDVVRRVHDFVGYPSENLDIRVDLSRQSPDIALGVDTGGAGDQGIMFGFASRGTDTFMPLACKMSRDLCNKLTELRKNGTLPWLRPDGKAQVTVRYDDEGRIDYIDNIVVSAQHSENIDIKKVREQLETYVIWPVLRNNTHNLRSPWRAIKLHINPTGRFVIGGAYGDSGLTGRKIVVDQYGSYCEVGGGAYSGKDPSKVDRSAAYAARNAEIAAVSWQAAP
jgi:S-adenosylmethionine synthetase